MVVFVLSCDKYRDVWDEFFNLKDKFWPDSDFEWYVVTESVQYERDGVKTITGGGDWSTRLRNAVHAVKADYICTFLDDYFITENIDNQLIHDRVEFMRTHQVSFLNMDDGFDHIRHADGLEPFDKDFVKIPKHLAYGVDTAGAIWDREYLLQTLGDGDYSAWQFELDRCKEAASEEGLKGLILMDLLQPLHISKIPVIIQGAYYPPAIRFFKKQGYVINCHDRKVMSTWDVFVYWLKRKGSGMKHGRKFMKWVGRKVFGLTFVSED